MIHVTKENALKLIAEAVDSADRSDKFMVAVWNVKENGELTCKRTTWQFPTARMEEGVAILSNMVRDELHPMRTPLPLASFLRPAPANHFAAPRPIEQDETVSDLPGAPPIVNAVLPLDSEDGE